MLVLDFHGMGALSQNEDNNNEFVLNEIVKKLTEQNEFKDKLDTTVNNIFLFELALIEKQY